MSDRAYVISDLHLDAWKKSSFDEVFLDPEGKPDRSDYSDNLLVLAGDVCQFSNPQYYVPFIKECVSRFDTVLWIPGNHEWYHSCFTLDTIYEVLNRIGADGHRMRLVDREVVEWHGHRIACATLWTNFWDTPGVEAICRNVINDFRCIKIGNRRFTTGECKWFYEDTKQFLVAACNHGVDAVVTHFAPSKRSIHRDFSQYRDTNAYFCSNLLDDGWPVEWDKMPHWWAHGHTHRQMRYEVVHGGRAMRVVCNPVGYPDIHEQAAVRRSAQNHRVIMNMRKEDGREHAGSELRVDDTVITGGP